MREGFVVLLSVLLFAAPAQASKHRHRVSHVKACTTLVGAPCQADLKRNSSGGAVYTPIRSIGGGAVYAS